MKIYGLVSKGSATRSELNAVVAASRAILDVQERIAARVMMDVKVTAAALKAQSTTRNSSEISHSEKNVAQWLTYLPTDCVAAMVRQGWERSVR